MNKNVLWVFASWEERSFLGVQQDVFKHSIDVLYLLSYEVSLHPDKVNDTKTKICELCKDKNISVKEIILPSDSVCVWHSLYNEINAVSDNEIMHIDITTMPRYVVWSMLFFMVNRNMKITYSYHTPAAYNNDWVSKEPDNPQLLLKHSGIVEFGKPTALVIITGFDYERTGQLIDFYEPKKVFVGIQEGSQHNNQTRNTEEAHLKQFKGQLDYECFDIDAYKICGYEAIKEIIQANEKEYNIIVSSLGPKLSAIALYKYYLTNKNIALCYIPCKEYNEKYCQGIGDSFYEEFDYKFGEI